MTKKTEFEGQENLDAIKQRREFLSAAAKIATVASVLGLSAASAAHAITPLQGETVQPVSIVEVAAAKPAKTRALQLRGIIDSAIRTGDRETMLKQAAEMRLSEREMQALRNLTVSDLRVLSWIAERTAGLSNLADAADGGATGYVVF